MSYITRVTRLCVLPEGHAIFSEQATTIEIDDEAAGEFVIVKQDDAKVVIEPDAWPALRAAIDRMVDECRKEAE